MTAFLIGFMIGGSLGFLICAIFTSNAIQEARFNEMVAKDYARLLESQKEQN